MHAQPITSDPVLTQAFRWLCETRAHYHHNDDAWHVRYWWAREKPMLQAQLRAGAYRLSECRVVQGRDRRSDVWCAMDALVLKALAVVLGMHLQPQLSRRCGMEETEVSCRLIGCVVRHPCLVALPAAVQ